MGFFDDLTGKTQQRTMVKANNKAMTDLGAYYRAAKGDLNTGYAGAESALQPYAEAGNKGFGAYADSIGVNGAEGYGRAFQNFNADPFGAEEGMAARRAIQQAMRGYNANGQANSGVAALGAARIGSERYANRVSDYRNRLAGFGDAGRSTAGSIADLRTGRGNALANLNYGYGQQRAGNHINLGNAMAQAQSAGANNILSGLSGLVGTAIQGFTPGIGGATPFSKMFGG